MRAPLRWVLWDVKDTLLKVRRSVGEQYCEEAQKAGLSLNSAEVDAAFRQAYRHHSRHYPNYGIAHGLGGQTWWKGVVEDTFTQCRVHDPALLSKLADNLYHNFCGPENWEIFPDSEMALKSCSSMGLKLGVVSNFDNRLEGILRGCGLLSHFSFLLTSEDAGIAKPNPVIFEQAIQKCGVPASNIAHVGDHYIYDYLTSRSLGIQGYLLERDHKDSHPDVPSRHLLRSLKELPRLLIQDVD